ncbi:MAG: PEP/pyruvate-binding domain-containing protein, partial [Candidatus Zixiibacteriota bacterium]
MTEHADGRFQDLDWLQKRADELNCLYRIKDILRTDNKSTKEIGSEIARIIPPSMMHPEDCQIKIIIDKSIYTTRGFQETIWNYSKEIACHDSTLGSIAVYYTKEHPVADSGPFFKEEIKLIDTIAGLLGQYLVSLNIKKMVIGINDRSSRESQNNLQEWPALLDMLKYTNRELYYRICRKILNVLNWRGNEEANKLLKSINSNLNMLRVGFERGNYYSFDNNVCELPSDVSQAIIEMARTYISDDIMLQHIQRWLQEEKLGYLSQVINRNLSIEEVADSIRRYYEMAPADQDLRFASKWGIQVSLIRRFLSEQSQYVNTAKPIVDIKDFDSLLKNMVYSAESRGKLGGKSAILFLIDQILKKEQKSNQLLDNVKIPKTWFISSDVVYHFMHYNNFDDVVEQKYKDSDQIRLEYPQIVQSFINGQFPEDIIKRLSVALDDLNEKPLIVRSSSLLENQIGSTFFGKYKSIIIANKGNKRERLGALMSAIAEVYASTFSPDPIEYRQNNDLLDIGEEMGIMIQEVVGTRIGKYYLPLCSGIAYSDNMFRWTKTIKQEDGLICISPGLRIRPENHNKIEFPVLVIPGQPEFTNIKNSQNYIPSKIIAINTETGGVETIDAEKFIKEHSSDLQRFMNTNPPVYDNGYAEISNDNYKSGDSRIAYKRLLINSPIQKQIDSILKLLKGKLDLPVDIEFAYDGTDLYILQCRSYNYLNQNLSVSIPKDIPDDQIIFSADRFIVNGILPEIKYIVYIDPLQYRDRADKQNITSVNKLIKRLNKLLPKKQYVVMG